MWCALTSAAHELLFDYKHCQDSAQASQKPACMRQRLVFTWLMLSIMRASLVTRSSMGCWSEARLSNHLWTFCSICCLVCVVLALPALTATRLHVRAGTSTAVDRRAAMCEVGKHSFIVIVVLERAEISCSSGNAPNSSCEQLQSSDTSDHSVEACSAGTRVFVTSVHRFYQHIPIGKSVVLQTRVVTTAAAALLLPPCAASSVSY